MLEVRVEVGGDVTGVAVDGLLMLMLMLVAPCASRLNLTDHVVGHKELVGGARSLTGGCV